MSIESIAIELMSKSDFKNEPWESFSNSITEEVESQMNIELDKFEKLDLEAKSVEASFYVI